MDASTFEFIATFSSAIQGTCVQAEIGQCDSQETEGGEPSTEHRVATNTEISLRVNFLLIMTASQ